MRRKTCSQRKGAQRAKCHFGRTERGTEYVLCKSRFAQQVCIFITFRYKEPSRRRPNDHRYEQAHRSADFRRAADTPAVAQRSADSLRQSSTRYGTSFEQR